MKLKQLLISGYAVIAVLFALYGMTFGAEAYKGFAWNLGKAVVWPVVIFPSLGKLIGGIVWILVIGAILVFARKDR